MSITDDEIRQLSTSLVATLRRMTENATAAVLWEQINAMESVIFPRLDRIEKTLGITGNGQATETVLKRISELRAAQDEKLSA